MPKVKLELDNFNSGAFNLYEDNHKIGTMMLSIDDDKLMAFHTEVTPGNREKGYAKQMFDEMVNYARENELKVIPICPYIRNQLKNHPDKYEGLWEKIQISL